MKARALVSGLALMATLVAVGLVLQGGLFGEWLNEAWIDRAVRDRGVGGELLYLGVAALATSLGLPRQVVSFLGGYAFGATLGTALALLGTEIGCVATFGYARAIGRPLIGARLDSRVRRVEDFLSANPFTMTLLVRLLPVGSNFVTNLAAGLTRVPARPFFLGSLAGYLPQTLVFALAGSGVGLGATPRVVAAVLLFVAIGFIGRSLYHNYRRGRSLGDDVDAALEEPPADAGGAAR